MRSTRAGRRRATLPASAGRGDGGMVTAELAVALPALLLVLAVCLGVVGVVAARIRCIDAAAVAARLAARGETDMTVLDEVRGIVPRATVTMRRSADGFVRVDVRERLRLPVVGLVLPGVTVAEHLAVPDESVRPAGTGSGP